MSNNKDTVKRKMSINRIKEDMLAYNDFYGGDLIGSGDIKKAKTKRELVDIIETHRSFMEDMLSDAHSHLDSFKKKVGLNIM